MPPAGYDARAFALPAEDIPEEQRRSVSPVWNRRSSSFRRNSSPSSSSRHGRNWRTQLMKNYGKLQKQALKTYNKLSVLQRVLAACALVITAVLGILFLVYHEKIFHALIPVVKKWRDIRAGWLIIWFLIFFVSFPPMIGYSSLLTIAGFVYGFPNSWFIVASATVVGSTCSFLVSRSLLKNMVQRLVANDPRFAALSLTLKHDGIKILVMIRFCPLPYSLSNGAIATFPTVKWQHFAIATAISTVKLLLHVFVGARLGEIAERGEQMDTKTKVLSYFSIVIGVVAGIATGWIIYRQTKARAKELEEQERANIRRSSVEDLENEYMDDPEALQAAERLREEEDDISLHHARIHRDLAPYRDESGSSSSDEDTADDPFNEGDGDEEQGLVDRNPGHV